MAGAAPGKLLNNSGAIGIRTAPISLRCFRRISRGEPPKAVASAKSAVFGPKRTYWSRRVGENGKTCEARLHAYTQSFEWLLRNDSAGPRLAIADLSKCLGPGSGLKVADRDGRPLA